MPCASFEDRLLDYGTLTAAERTSVDAHLANCAACREYIDVLAAMDAGLTNLYGGLSLSPALPARAVAPAKLSFVPELLDFLGWAAVIALVVGALLFFVPMPALVTPALIVASAIAVSAAAWIGLRSFAELRG